ERVAGADEAGCLLRGVDVQAPGEVHRLVGHHADREAVGTAEAHDDVVREARVHLQELAAVQHVLYDVVHVVGLVGGVWDRGVQFGVDGGDRQYLLVRAAGDEGGRGGGGGGRVGQVGADGGDRQYLLVRAAGDDGGRGGGGVVEVVGGQVGQQVTGEVQALVLVLGLEVRHAGLGVVRVRAAQVLEAHLLPCHGLDHVGPGDEHVRDALDHQGEVGDRGGVHRAARARPHDQADLRDDPGREHVPAEDLGEQAERDHALLDPGAAAVVDADDRAADLQRVVHDLDDLLPVDLAERAAEHGEVLAEDADRPAVDRAVPGDHAIAIRAVRGHPEVRGAVPGQLVQLGERARVQQPLDPLAGGHLALGVLALDRAQRTVLRLVPAPLQVSDLARRGVQVHGGPAFLGSLRLVRYGFVLSGRIAEHAPQVNGSGRLPGFEEDEPQRLNVGGAVGQRPLPGKLPASGLVGAGPADDTDRERRLEVGLALELELAIRKNDGPVTQHMEPVCPDRYRYTVQEAMADHFAV